MTTETAQNTRKDQQERDQPGHIRWRELCKTGQLSDMPYKVETNARGQVVMSPTALYHGSWQAHLVLLLRKHRAEGQVVVEAGVETADGTKVADIAWFRPEHWSDEQGRLAASRAPALCIEVASPSNSTSELLDKRTLYFDAGAEEVWICSRVGELRFFTPTKEVPTSALVPAAPSSLRTEE